MFPLEADKLIPLFQRAHDSGARHVEVGGEACGRVDPRSVGALLQEFGMSGSICALFGAERDISSLNPSVREAGLAHARDCREFAEAAGIPLVVGSFAGAGGAHMLSVETRRERLELAAESLRQLSSEAEPGGTRLAVEALNRYENNLLNTTVSVADLVADLPDNVGILADTFHMSTEERNLPRALLACGERLFHVHAVSNFRGAPADQPEDCVDWNGVFDALRRLRYNGALVIETINPSATALAEPARFWRAFAPSQDDLVRSGVAFLASQCDGEAASDG